MTQQEILEYNKRCAEFLEWESLSPKTKYCYWKFPQELCFKLRAPEPIHSNNLLFHSDWNWIMEVVEKIESEGSDFKINAQWNHFNESSSTQVSVVIRVGEISSDRKFMYNIVNVYEKHTPLLRSKKEAIVQAINCFLIWYNDQKQGKNV